jgi:hypothetical protein
MMKNTSGTLEKAGFERLGSQSVQMGKDTKVRHQLEHWKARDYRRMQ